jgi:hypothetical protein
MASTLRRSTGLEPYLAMKSSRRATPTFVAPLVEKIGMKRWFWMAWCIPARSSSSLSPSFSKNFSMSESSLSATYSITC